MDKDYDVITLSQNTFILRPGVANFLDITKVVTMFIKTTFKTQKKS